MATREQNERKFGNWRSLPDSGRQYSYDIAGRNGWKARYIKEVDANELTIRFYQEIYDASGKLIEVHMKFPVNTGHQPVQEG